MASFSISLECRTGPAMDALDRIAETWPPEKLDAFAQEWGRLQEAGAQMVEAQLVGGRIVAHPSEDFTMHLSKWGVHLW